MNALLKRAGNMGTISAHEKLFMDANGKAGYRLNEPVPLPHEESTQLMNSLTCTAWNSATRPKTWEPY